MHRITAAALSAALLLAGCATNATPQPVPALSAQAATCDSQARLLAASAGLLLTSETDAPWSWVSFNLRRLPDPADLPALVGIPAAAVEVRDFGAYFDRLTTVYDPADPVAVENARRYAELRAVFESEYRALRVYRVQNADNLARWDVFVLGVNKCGVSGLTSWAIET